MSATIIPFPGVTRAKPDPLDRLVEILASSRDELPSADAEQIKLLRRIDRKLAQLVKVIRQGGGL